MSTRTPRIFLAFFVMGFVDAVGTLVGFAQEEHELSGFMAGLLPFFGFIAPGLFSGPGGVHSRAAVGARGDRDLMNIKEPSCPTPKTPAWF